MRKILILLSLSLVFLNASPYNLERLKQEENSIAKDYYIYRLLEKKIISKKEAEGLNSHIFRYVGKIKSELEKIIPVKIFIDPKY
ncbi:lytic transglycosylase domain-containing protein, partial [Campylobacter coli]